MKLERGQIFAAIDKRCWAYEDRLDKNQPILALIVEVGERESVIVLLNHVRGPEKQTYYANRLLLEEELWRFASYKYKLIDKKDIQDVFKIISL